MTCLKKLARKYVFCIQKVMFLLMSLVVCWRVYGLEIWECSLLLMDLHFAVAEPKAAQTRKNLGLLLK